jgi:hypothetical protein
VQASVVSGFPCGAGVQPAFRGPGSAGKMPARKTARFETGHCLGIAEQAGAAVAQMSQASPVLVKLGNVVCNQIDRAIRGRIKCT